jgi:hypothetical protein
MVSIAVLSISGCGYIGPPSGAYAGDQYDNYGVHSTDLYSVGMTEAETLEAYNDRVGLEDKIVCRRSSITGSHFKNTRCTSYSQRKEEMEAANQYMRMNRVSERQLPRGRIDQPRRVATNRCYR